MQEDWEVTRDQSEGPEGPVGRPVPGLLLVFSGRQPQFGALPLGEEELVLGRGACGDLTIQDGCVSRQHAVVRLRAGEVEVQDLGSRNGSFVDGEPARTRLWTPARLVIRVGDTLFVPSPDVRSFLHAEVMTGEGRVAGPTSQAVAASIGRAAQYGSTLHIQGESGVGKEGAARLFHKYGPHAKGPFVAVNCAAIPEGIAERLLFGARKGAFSGANADSEGYIQAANGGTLFLDEIGDLDLLVQGKLLRVLETREVLALGATRATPVDLRLCSATHKDLRAQVTAGRLREDLYFRIGRPEVAIPPLRARREEIPWLIAMALQQVQDGLSAAPNLIETCLLRPWPGNIRELLTEVKVAAQEALAAGVPRVEKSHLSRRAGMEFAPAEPQPAAVSPVDLVERIVEPPTLPSDTRSPEAKAVLVAALQRAEGNVSRTARHLGMHRTQLRRLLAYHGLSGKED